MSEKKENTSTKEVKKKNETSPTSIIKVVTREIVKDKVALTAVIVIILVILLTFGGSLFLNKTQVTEANIMEAYYGWGEHGHLLGTDDGGRDILKLLMMGGRNSILIGLGVTVVCETLGLIVGLVSGYYGGYIDAVIMRIVDFIQVLPAMPIEIVLVSVIPNYSPISLVWIISLFGWTGTARYFRAFVLSQRGRDYVLASKTSGSPDIKIMFREVLPNITSMVIIDVVLTVASNIGIEATLSFIGYGLPPTVPSLGTLIGFANDPINVMNRPWLWLPATVLLLSISLSINYVGRALQRAGDARQREN